MRSVVTSVGFLGSLLSHPSRDEKAPLCFQVADWLSASVGRSVTELISKHLINCADVGWGEFVNVGSAKTGSMAEARLAAFWGLAQGTWGGFLSSCVTKL